MAEESNTPTGDEREAAPSPTSALLGSMVRESPWAVRQETLAAIVTLLKGGVSASAELPTAARMNTVSTTGGVAVIPLRGLLTASSSFLSLLFGGGGGLRSFRQSFREALASDEVSSILIDVDSPGGSTDLIEETAAEIRAARGEKQIVAIANTDAASAAYYIAAQADELVVTPSGEVGSIGVFMLHWDESGLNEAIGIHPTYIFAGRYKVEANPDEPLSDEAKAHLQAVVDDFYGMFVDAVAAGRGVSAETVRTGFGEGRTVTAERAVGLGMADRVESYEQTIGRLTGREPDPRRSAAAPDHARSRAMKLARPRPR